MTSAKKPEWSRLHRKYPSLFTIMKEEAEMIQIQKTREIPEIRVETVPDQNGRRSTQWINANDTAESIYAKIVKMLPAPNEPTAGQWAIKSYRGFGCIRLSEHEDIGAVAAIGQGICKYGTIFAEVTARVGPYEAADWMESGYRGAFNNLEEYARKDCESFGERLDALPRGITDYIDYAAMGKDLESGSAIIVIPHWGMLHVFVPNQ